MQSAAAPVGVFPATDGVEHLAVGSELAEHRGEHAPDGLHVDVLSRAVEMCG